MVMLKTGINRTQRTLLWLLIGGSLGSCSGIAAARKVNIEDFVSYSARVRSESVKVQDDNGSALTVKLRIAVQRSLIQGFRAFAEIDHVQSFLDRQHSDGVLRIDEPVIADPAGTEFNQLYFSASLDNLNVVLGRQTIIFDDQRFIGDVGFRQNSQTFDGLSISLESVSGLSIDYTYINQVNRIFGDKAGSRLSSKDVRFGSLNGQRPAVEFGDHDVDGHLIHIKYDGWDYVNLTSFAYWVHNKDFSPFSNRTVGASADYRYKYGKARWAASLTIARQVQQESVGQDWMNYWQWELGVELKPIQVSLRQERFGEKNGRAFTMPLATLHKFQGWADQFLATPEQGLVDNSVRLLWRRRPFTLDLRYHRFDSDLVTFGKELNLDLIYKPNRKHEFKLRLADFNAANSQTITPNDVNKLFLIYSYNL